MTKKKKKVHEERALTPPAFLLRKSKSTAEMIRFAVEFSRMDLPTLRQGDWINLKQDVEEFLISPKIIGIPTSVRPLSDCSKEEFLSLQSELRNLLGEWV